MKAQKSVIPGFLFTVVFGSLLHFAYQWSGNNALVGLFAPVNESAWEHLKLIITPMVLYGIIELFGRSGKRPNFIPVRVLSIIYAMLLTITVFYTYSGIIGKNYLVIDILIFIVSVYAAYRFGARLMQTERFSSPLTKLVAIVLIILLIGAFAVFTVDTPHIDLFKDQNTGDYGARLFGIK